MGMTGEFDAGAIVIDLEMNTIQFGRDVDRSMQKLGQMERKAAETEAKYKRFGTIAMRSGAVVAGALGLMVKAASDAQESHNKFAVVFKDVYEEAASAARELNESYGQSKMGAEALLSATGDLLTGMGMQGKQALKLSAETQKLAVDLASFQNLQGGAKRASEALTKAMLGERESAKLLGIVIREEDVQARLAAKGQKELTGAALMAAKAQITLEMATEQSKNAIGDFGRTSDSFANTLRRLKAKGEDLAAGLGAVLLPAATKIANVFVSILDGFNKLMETVPGLKNVFMTLATVAGSVGISFGLLTKVSPKLAVKIGELIRNHKMLAGAFGIAVTAGLFLRDAILALDKAYLESMDVTKRVAMATSVAERKLLDFLKQADKEHAELIRGQIQRDLAAGKSYDAVMQGMYEHLQKNSTAWKKWSGDVAVAQGKAQAATKEGQAKIASIMKEVFDDQHKLTMSEFEYERQKTKEWFEEKKIALQTAFAEEQKIDTLRQVYRMKLAEIAKSERQAAIEAEKKANDELTASIFESIKTTNDNALQSLATLSGATMAALSTIKSENVKATTASQAAWESFRKSDKKNAEEWADHLNKQTQKMTNYSTQAINTIAALGMAAYQNRLKSLEDEYSRRRQAIIDNVSDEGERESQLAALDEEYQRKKKDLEIQQAKREKKIAIVRAIIDTARAVAAALPNFILAGIAAAMGAAQIATIKSQPIPMREGGYVKEDGTAMLHKGEVVVPYEKVEERILGSGSGGGGAGQTVNIYAIDAASFEDFFRKRGFPVIRDGMLNEELLVPAKAVKGTI